jgi:hypothetical protein
MCFESRRSPGDEAEGGLRRMVGLSITRKRVGFAISVDFKSTNSVRVVQKITIEQKQNLLTRLTEIREISVLKSMEQQTHPMS